MVQSGKALTTHLEKKMESGFVFISVLVSLSLVALCHSVNGSEWFDTCLYGKFKHCFAW